MRRFAANERHSVLVIGLVREPHASSRFGRFPMDTHEVRPAGAAERGGDILAFGSMDAPQMVSFRSGEARADAELEPRLARMGADARV